MASTSSSRWSSTAREDEDDDDALAAAFRASGAAMACLCSSDAIYVERAAAATRALSAAGARKIWLAGKPGDNEASLRAAGVDGFIFAGCDVLAALTSL
jgi:methylmalonyl-CoA mutase